MNDKWLRIDGELHRRIKVRSAELGTSIKDWVESVCADALDKRLVDTREQYTTKGADND